MNDLNPELIEKYQLMMQENPRAKVFAPLAEAYRRMGLIKEGVQICLKGLEYHPNFASGRVALGRLYLASEKYDLAAEQLQKAVDISPENLLAQSLLGDSYLKLKQPKEALKAFKMLLFLSPMDERAQKNVRKLESLTADEFDEDVFAMNKLSEAAETVNQVEFETPEALLPVKGEAEAHHRSRDLERFLSLSDAFLVRSDFERAQQTLEDAARVHGQTPEVIRRLKLLSQRFSEEDLAEDVPVTRRANAKQRKIALLKEFKAKISKKRRKA